MQRYEITGMSCAACASHVEKAVAAVPGVASVAVSLLTNSMQVDYAPDVDPDATARRILRAVDAAGYGASLASAESESAELEDTETPKLKKRLIASLCFLVPLMYVSMGHMIGLPLGIALTLTDENGITPNRAVYRILDIIINVTRSVPFLILLIAVMPLTKLLVGKGHGSTATIVPLTLAAAPLVGRMVESSLKEVPAGVIEAALSMGAKTGTIVRKVLIGEARTSLLVGGTIVLGTVLGYSAMAGVIGGGGLGDIAIRYGYYRYDTGVMLVTLVFIVAIVQLLQGMGNLAARKIDHRK